jgi:hypothetical protein
MEVNIVGTLLESEGDPNTKRTPILEMDPWGGVQYVTYG